MYGLYQPKSVLCTNKNSLDNRFGMYYIIVIKHCLEWTATCCEL